MRSCGVERPVPLFSSSRPRPLSDSHNLRPTSPARIDHSITVIPAKAGIYRWTERIHRLESHHADGWFPAFAGMTPENVSERLSRARIESRRSVSSQHLQNAGAGAPGRFQSGLSLSLLDRVRRLRTHPPICFSLIVALLNQELLEAFSLRPGQSRVIGRPCGLERTLAIEAVGEMRNGD